MKPYLTLFNQRTTLYPDGEGPGYKDWRKGVYLIKVAKEKGYKIDKHKNKNNFIEKIYKNYQIYF